MERRTVGCGKEKHFYCLDQPVLAQSTPKHTRLNHLVSMKSKCTFIIHIPGLLANTQHLRNCSEAKLDDNKSSFNCPFLVPH